MRTVTLALIAGLSACGWTAAQAADLDYGYLRGPEYEPPAPLIDWSGVYLGGHGGYSSAALDFKNVFQPLVYSRTHDSTAESIFGASTLLSARSQRVDSATYGAIAGYNFQFDDVVIGIEGDYTRFGKYGSSYDSIGRVKMNGDFKESVELAGVTSTRVQDYGTIRARAGYALGNFMPFVTGGVAVGRALIVDAVNVQHYGYNLATFNANQAVTNGAAPAYVNNFGYSAFSQSNPEGSVPDVQTVKQAKTKVVAGVALGAGLEFALTSNIVLRGEYQYVLLNDFDGHKVNLNTVRGGAAVKF
ncbi:outer membrane protein [Methylobacterium sp. A54F]